MRGFSVISNRESSFHYAGTALQWSKLSSRKTKRHSFPFFFSDETLSFLFCALRFIEQDTSRKCHSACFQITFPTSSPVRRTKNILRFLLSLEDFQRKPLSCSAESPWAIQQDGCGCSLLRVATSLAFQWALFWVCRTDGNRCLTARHGSLHPPPPPPFCRCLMAGNFLLPFFQLCGDISWELPWLTEPWQLSDCMSSYLDSHLH